MFIIANEDIYIDGVSLGLNCRQEVYVYEGVV